MLTPEYLQGLPEELEQLTMGLEQQLIEDISRRIAKAGQITDTAAYQMIRLKELGASTEYLEKLIADYLNISEQAVQRMIFDAAQTDSEFYEAVYARAGRAYVPYEYNEYLQQLAVAAVNQTCGELVNLTRSMGFAVRGADGRLTFKPAAKAYQSALDKAHMLVASGGMDYITAVRMAVGELASSGVRFVDYDSGVRNHADVAVRRAVLTGVSQMTGQIALHNAAELGTDVVEVDAHAGARPDHAVWQGRWFSLTGKDKRYPLLSQATGYGTVTGLKGANCRHDFYPVIPGIDEPAYTEEELRNIDPPPVTVDGRRYTYYEAEQRQREIERAIRKTKRQIIAAQASGDEEQFTAKSVLLRRQRTEYKEFSDKAGLIARNERTQVYGYGRSVGSKAGWAARKSAAVRNITPKPLDNGAGSGIIRIERSMAAKSFEKAAAYANKNFSATISSLSELPLDTVNAVNNAIHKLYKDIPSLSGFIDEIIVDDIDEIVTSSMYWVNGSPQIRLKLSRAYFANMSISEIETAISDLVGDGIFTPKSGIYGILKHEAVHFAEFKQTLKRYGYSQEKVAKSLDMFELADKIKAKALANCSLDDNEYTIMKYLGNYAGYSSAEFIAEGYSSTDSNILTNEIKRLLKKKWGM